MFLVTGKCELNLANGIITAADNAFAPFADMPPQRNK
jgi:hypothetical protein